MYFHASKKKLAVKLSEMNRIKEVLDAKGVKQTWLADQLGKSYNMINGYAKNRRQPSLEVLYKIAQLLEVEATELLIKNENVEKRGGENDE